MKSRALVSMSNIFDSNHYIFNDGKLEALWFDEIYLQYDHDNLHQIVDKMVKSKCSNATIDELMKIWIPVTKMGLSDMPTDNILISHGSVKNIDVFVDTIFKDRTLRDILEKENRGAMVDSTLKQLLINMTYHAVDLWSGLNSDGRCTFMPGFLESKIMERTLMISSKRNPYDVFSEAIVSQKPNYHGYSWDDIVEMRHHAFHEAFRKKIVEIYNMIESGDSRAQKEIIEEIKLRDMGEYIRNQRPTTDKKERYFAKTIKLITSFFPSAINPFAYAEHLQKKEEENLLKKKCGWIYFMDELK